MVSRKDGGGDEEINLITSCFDCNRGKAGDSVDISKTKGEKFELEMKQLEEKKSQLNAYYRYIKKSKKLKKKEIKIFLDAWEEASDGENYITKKGEKDIRRLLESNSAEMILKSIDIAWDRYYVPNDEKFTYMCGVLKHLREDQDG